MKIIESNPKGPLAGSTLAEFERKLGHVLPGEYRDFLLQHNGPKVEPTSFWVPDGEYYSEIEEYFYGLHGDHYSFGECYFPYKEQFPAGFLPIADNGGGNSICLALEEGERGRIYYFDHEINDETSGPHDMSLLAETFPAFLDALQEYDEDEDEDEEDEEENNPPGEGEITLEELISLWQRYPDFSLKESLRPYFGKIQLHGAHPDYTIHHPSLEDGLALLELFTTKATPTGIPTTGATDFPHGEACCSLLLLFEIGHVETIHIAGPGYIFLEDFRYWSIDPAAWQRGKELADRIMNS